MSTLLRSNNINRKLISIHEAQFQKSSCTSIDLTGGPDKNSEHNWTVINTAPPKTASARTAVGHNHQSGLNNVDYNAMPDVESSQRSSDMNGDDEEDLDDHGITAGERVRSDSTDLRESKDEQKVSFTEQVRNEPYNLAKNDRAGTAGPVDSIDEDSPSYDGINDHDHRTRGARTVHTAAYQAQQFGFERVE